MLLRKGTAFMLGLALTAGLTACGTTGGQVKGQSYGRDGLLGTTSSNPNVPVNPGFHDYASDVRLLKESIGQIPGVADSHIVLNGPTAYVTLQLREDIDIEESMRIRNSAQTTLQRMMPRYNVKVSVAKNRMY